MREAAVTSPNMAASLQATRTLSICVEGHFLCQVSGPPSPASFPHLAGQKASGVSADVTTSEWGEGEGQESSSYIPPPHSRDVTAVHAGVLVTSFCCSGKS